MHNFSYPSFSQLVSQGLETLFSSLPDELQAYLAYMHRGKRLRSRLMYEVGRLLKVEGQQLLLGAVGLELIHTITLLHDDVIDAEKKRRGQHTLNALFTDQAAIFSGNYLLLKGLQAFSNSLLKSFPKAQRLSCSETLLRNFRSELVLKIGQLCEGEMQQDFIKINTDDFSLEQALQIARLKTGALFALSFKFPALGLIEATGPKNADRVSEAAKRELVAFAEECGYLFGVFYQLLDDLKDLQKDLRTVKEKKLFFNNWTYPSLLWKHREPEGLTSFISGRQSIIPPHIYDYVRTETYQKIKLLLGQLRKKVAAEDGSGKGAAFSWLVAQKQELYDYLVRELREQAPQQAEHLNFFV